MSGAQLSDYGRRVEEERRALLGALVQRLAGTQPDTGRHRSLLEGCLAAVQHHRFADANPREVDEQLDRLGDRLGEHALFVNQRALQLLRVRLGALPLESSQYEFRHRLLAFLYAASRAPLSTRYPGSQLVETLEHQARTAVVGEPTYLSDSEPSSADSWVEQSGMYSPGSQLSEWSDGGEEGGAEEGEGRLGAALASLTAATAGAGAAALGGSAALPAGAHAHAEPGAHPGGGFAADAARAPSPDAGLARLFPPAFRRGPRRESPYTRTSLSVWLASKQSGGAPARVLQPALCFHERELVQQVIHMLKGVAEPGPAFQLDPVRGAYLPRPGAHLHSSSHGSARALLARFALVGTAVRRVQAFCGAASGCAGLAGAAAEGEGPEGERRRLLSLPTVAAFAAAVAEQQQGLQQQVLVLEAAAASGALQTLMQLQQRTACLADQAALLAAVVRGCCVWRGSPADTAAGLLTSLHGALQQQMLLARSQGGVLAGMLLGVFAAACRPLLTTLHKWLYQGVLDDPWQEFFVQAADASIPTDSPRFWAEAFSLRPASGSSSAAAGPAGPAGAAAPAAPAAPCFLAPLADSILSAGKATLLLQAYCSWRLAAAAAFSTSHPAAAAAQRLEAEAPAGGAGGDPCSPAKRRLSEFGALGFAVAAERQGPGLGQSAAVLQPVAPPGEPPGGGFWAGSPGGSGGEGGAGAGLAEPPLLHQQMLSTLEAQLREQLDLAASLEERQQELLTLGSQPAGARQTPEHDGVGAAEEEEQEAGSSAGSSASASSRLFCADWQAHAQQQQQQQLQQRGECEKENDRAAAAACSGHTLHLPVQDTLPPLAPVPASAEGLPAASIATIRPGEVGGSVLDPSWPALPANRQAALAAAPAASAQATGRASSGGGSPGSFPTVAERMRQAGAARTAAATSSAALEQLPLLFIQPTPLESCLAAGDSGEAAAGAGKGVVAAAVGAGASAAGGPAEEEEVGQAGAAEAPAGAADFESSGWQEWYEQTAQALSQQLHVLDCFTSQSTAPRLPRLPRLQAGSSACAAPGLPPPAPAYGQRWGGSSSLNAGSNGSSGWLAAAPAPGGQGLQPGLLAEAPPLDVLLQRSLLQPVQMQAEAAGAELCTVLLRRGLLRQLAALRETFLLGSPLLQPFISFLLRRISTATGGLERVSEFELSAALQDALAAVGARARALRASVTILPAPAGGAGGPGVQRQQGQAQQGQQQAQQGQQGQQPGQQAQQGGIPQRVHELSRLRLRVDPGWPLSLVVGEEMLEQYNAVLVLLMQLRWVKQSLQSVRYAGWKAGRLGSQRPSARDGLQHQMVHLVDSVQQYMNDRVVAAGVWLEQALEGCASLDAMHRCRAKYLRAVTRYCLLSPDGVARLVHEALLHLLNACLQYCSLHKQLESTAAALGALAQQALRARQAGSSNAAAAGRQAAAGGEDEGEGEEEQEEAVAAGARAGPAGVQWAGRRAELERRAGELRRSLASLKRDFTSRQRLLVRVLAAKAAEAGSHADELRQLLGALDFSRHFEASMA